MEGEVIINIFALFYFTCGVVTLMIDSVGWQDYELMKKSGTGKEPREYPANRAFKMVLLWPFEMYKWLKK